jgi:hypothetical protein
MYHTWTEVNKKEEIARPSESDLKGAAQAGEVRREPSLAHKTG